MRPACEVWNSATSGLLACAAAASHRGTTLSNAAALSNDKSARMTQKPVFVCSHVFKRRCPILLVSHSDEDWEFLCGGAHEEEELPSDVSLHDLLEADPTLWMIVDLPVNWEAERESAEAAWEKWPIH